jgi:mRNA deadenylase 3'-5' endonuclease subunit Ccr4
MKGLKETFVPGLRRIDLQCCGFAPTKPDAAPRGKNGHRNIGCAVFFNPNKLSLISAKKIHLKDFASLQNCRSHEFHVDVHSKWNSMAMVMFKTTTTNQTIVIGNTHLYWNPLREDIKAMQSQAVIEGLSKFCESHGFLNKKTYPPLILCGDFNTMPSILHDEFGSQSSAAFELLNTGKLSSLHPHHPDKFFNSMVNSASPNPRLGFYFLFLFKNLFFFYYYFYFECFLCVFFNYYYYYYYYYYY